MKSTRTHDVIRKQHHINKSINTTSQTHTYNIQQRQQTTSANGGHNINNLITNTHINNTMQ